MQHAYDAIGGGTDPADLATAAPMLAVWHLKKRSQEVLNSEHFMPPDPHTMAFFYASLVLTKTIHASRR